MPPQWVWFLPAVAAVVAAIAISERIRRGSMRRLGDVVFVATIAGFLGSLATASFWEIDRSYTAEKPVAGWGAFSSAVVYDQPRTDEEPRYVTTTSGHQVKVDGTRAYPKGSKLDFSCPLRGEGYYGGEWYDSCRLTTPTEEKIIFHYPFRAQQVMLPVGVNFAACGLVAAGFTWWIMGGAQFPRRVRSTAKSDFVEEQPMDDPI